MSADPLKDAQQSLAQAITTTRRARDYYDYLKTEDTTGVHDALVKITDELCEAHSVITGLINQ